MWTLSIILPNLFLIVLLMLGAIKTARENLLAASQEPAPA
jgi:hypothetical protein